MRDVGDVHAHGRYLGAVELSGRRRTHVGQHAERRVFEPPRGIRRFDGRFCAAFRDNTSFFLFFFLTDYERSIFLGVRLSALAVRGALFSTLICLDRFFAQQLTYGPLGLVREQLNQMSHLKNTHF